MKYLKNFNEELIQEVTREEYNKIFTEIPVYKAVFTLKKIPNFLKGKLNIGDEVYNVNSSPNSDTYIALDGKPAKYAISPTYLKFLKYMTLDEIDKKIKLNKEVKKYNL